MKLGTILILVFILMGLFGSLGGTYYFYSQSSQIIESSVVSHLQSTAQTFENFIDGILEEQGEKLEIAATHGDLTNEGLREIRDLQEEFYEVFVLDSSGKIIASSDESRIGKDKSSDAYFLNARKETYLKPAYLSTSTQKESIAVSTPFHEGVLVARIELEAFNEIVNDRTGLGETGEVLLAYQDKDGKVVFFTERKFEEEIEREGDILPMEEALNGKEGVIRDLYDYRGVKVISVTRKIESIEVGLVVKIDEEEALGTARNQLIRTSIIIIIAIIILFSLVGYFISRLITKPIEVLKNQVDMVSKGQFDIQLGRSSIFEVQGLTESLDRVLASLKLAILRTGTSKVSLGLGEEFKQKIEKEDTYKKVYESSADAMMILDPTNGKFVDGNPATLKIFSVSSVEKFIQLTPQDLSPEKQPDGTPSGEKAKKMMELAMKKGSNRFSWTHNRFKGEEFEAEVNLVRFDLNGKPVLQATVRDLSGGKVVKKQTPALKAVVKRAADAAKSAITKPATKKIITPKIITKPVVKKIVQKVVKPAVKKKSSVPTKQELEEVFGKK